MNYNCECCNKNLNDHPTHGHVCASACGPISLRYCDECLKEGVEPYGILVSYIGCFTNTLDDVNESYIELIKRSLEYHGKTMEEFKVDIKQCFDEITNAMCLSDEEWAEIDAISAPIALSSLTSEKDTIQTFASVRKDY